MPPLKLSLPLDPWTPAGPVCPRAARMRELLTVIPFRPAANGGERRAEIAAGVSFCLAKCGGCELTDGWTG